MHSYNYIHNSCTTKNVNKWAKKEKVKKKKLRLIADTRALNSRKDKTAIGNGMTTGN